MGEAVGAFIRQGTSIIKNRDTARLKVLARPAVIFTVTFLLGLVSGPMGVYPFGIAALCAARGGTAVIAATLGAALSSFTHEPEAVWHIAVQLLVAALRFFVCFLKGDLKEKRGLLRRLFCEAGYIRMILAAMGSAAFGCLTLIHTESIYYGLFSALLGIGMTLISTAAFMYLFDKSAPAQKRSAGLCLLCGGLCASLNAFGIPFNLGAVAAFLIPVYFSYCKESVLGASSGIAHLPRHWQVSFLQPAPFFAQAPMPSVRSSPRSPLPPPWAHPFSALRFCREPCLIFSIWREEPSSLRMRQG